MVSKKKKAQAATHRNKTCPIKDCKFWKAIRPVCAYWWQGDVCGYWEKSQEWAEAMQRIEDDNHKEV